MDKAKVLARLRSIEGHIRGVERMVEEDNYCVDIIHQTLAIKNAIDKVNQMILTDHLTGCVSTAIRSEESSERERVINELLELFQTSNKL
jgi:DNA-binding FrmR family transcriptional regulator